MQIKNKTKKGLWWTYQTFECGVKTTWYRLGLDITFNQSTSHFACLWESLRSSELACSRSSHLISLSDFPLCLLLDLFETTWVFWLLKKTDYNYLSTIAKRVNCIRTFYILHRYVFTISLHYYYFSALLCIYEGSFWIWKIVTKKDVLTPMFKISIQNIVLRNNKFICIMLYYNKYLILFIIF